MTSKLQALQSWVDQVAAQTQPDSIRWCTGSDAEYQEMIDKMLADGTPEEVQSNQAVIDAYLGV